MSSRCPIASAQTRFLRCLTVFCLIAAGWLCAPQATAQAGLQEVRAGLFITSLSAIDPRDGSFRVAAFAWFADPQGRFDPTRDMEVIARSASVEPFEKQPLAGGGTYTAVLIDAVVDHGFDVRDYPFDRQTLRFELESALPSDQLVFRPDVSDSRISADVNSPGWRIGTLSLTSTSRTYETGFGHRPAGASFSRITADIEISRKLSPFVFEKFAGFFVALLITGLVLMVPVAELGTRVGMTTGSIFAAVFNRYRLEDGIGFDAVFGVVDQVSLLTFSAILSMLLLSLTTHRVQMSRGVAAAGLLNRRVGAVVLAVHALLLGLAFAVAMA
ncbi:hypothetical protein [Tropicimonas isoalkanivorans]|uniref:hypothetical protein n=1 Tax=Tropicimonas isoalkanivorans TaxID=441112 RepID=UPI0011605942|nr:hypothetical protein [Tropicimonas isoalkanivorans]